MPPKTTTETTQEQTEREIRLEQELKELKEAVSLLKFAAEKIRREQDSDPNTMYDRASKIVEKSRMQGEGKNTWRVAIPGFVHAVEFKSDAERREDAIRDFETRFGTRFVKNKQRESDNHKIEKVS